MGGAQASLLRRTLLRTAQMALIALGLVAAGAAPAQTAPYPNRPVRIIVPFAAGGPADNYARFIAQRLQDTLGQAFVVEDRPGAGSLIGTDAVAKAAPDGYTLLLISNTHTVNETLITNKPYTLLRDLVPVAPLNYSDLLLVARSGLPVANVRDVLKLAKEKPGQLNYASSGNGTPYHMAGELFKSMTGSFIVHIPYRGSAGARVDVMGGQVDLMFDAVTTMAEQARAGKVRALATTGRQRSDVMPEVPTVAEAGVPGFEATIWLGVMAPRATPKTVVDRLNEAISKIVAQADVRQLWAKQGAVPLSMAPDAFERYMREDITKWERLIQSARIKPD